jgi:hypothetical protein
MASCDVLIVGGGTGGCAAALAACSLGKRVVLTEEFDWIGGQLTSQAVPPDENRWIESFGGTLRYRQFREGVRAWYRENYPLTDAARNDPLLNPGGGWVSRLCFEPQIGLAVLEAMLGPYVRDGLLTIHRRRKPVAAETKGDRVTSVTLRDLETGSEETIEATFVLDATETGELLPLTGTEYVVGAESRRETNEPHAVEGDPEPTNVQGITWCFAMGYDPHGEHVIEEPKQYEKWKNYRPSFWPGSLLSWETVHAHTMQRHTWTLFPHETQTGMGLFDYRQIVNPEIFRDNRPHAATIVNWPQNDYYAENILDEPEDLVAERLEEARQLSLSLLYWLQTEAPRGDGGIGNPGLFLAPSLTGTSDGLAMAPYIRESRRIRAVFTVLEQMVAEEPNPGKRIADPFPDSVGIGSYRLDLHPACNGTNTIDIGGLPFQIPLGALLPVRVENLLPACKNLGVTHISNGCYRLHPVDWNVGEAAGLLAGFCLDRRVPPRAVRESPSLLEEFQMLLVAQGIPLHWPEGEMGLED